MRSVNTGLRIPCAALILIVIVPSVVLGQEPGQTCCARFDYVLERTIFKVDAVRLELSVLDDTPERVARMVTGLAAPRQVSDTVAELYLGLERARVRMTFLRSFSLERFLDSNRGVLERLATAGLLTEEELRRLEAENDQRFAVLAQSGIRDGDVLEHEVQGDTVTTLYTDVAGAVRIAETRIGAAERKALVGSLFGPESGFRKGLLDLVFDRAKALSTP